MGNRVRKSVLNAEVEMFFYFLTLFVSFFSRKIFLENLGADFIGLTGTLMSILGILNLSELGIGLSISYFLFKPLANNDQDKINEILSLLGYLYKNIGFFISSAGIILCFFFPLIFNNTTLSLGIIYFAFLSFLGSNVIGYFINYRQIILSADQKMYLIAIYFKSFNILKALLQIALAIFYKNIYVWVGIEFVFSILECFILNWKINKEYPWLHTDKRKGRKLLIKYPEIIKKTKQILIHQLKDFFLTKSDEILIFIFISLKMVAYYGNYVMIITKLSTFFLTIFSGVSSGIGNLVAESSKQHIKDIFWELSSAKYMTAGILVISLSFLITPFIRWWLGEEYILSNTIVALFMINLYIMQTRPIVDMFNHSYGLYGDIWAAWAEGAINIIVTIISASKWGIVGILLGKNVSLFLIVTLWKPYYLYSQGFKESILSYWKGIIRYNICLVLAFAYMFITIHTFNIYPNPTLISIFTFTITEVLPTIILYCILLYYLGPGTKMIVRRIQRFRR